MKIIQVIKSLRSDPREEGEGRYGGYNELEFGKTYGQYNDVVDFSQGRTQFSVKLEEIKFIKGEKE